MAVISNSAVEDWYIFIEFLQGLEISKCSSNMLSLCTRSLDRMHRLRSTGVRIVHVRRALAISRCISADGFGKSFLSRFKFSIRPQYECTRPAFFLTSVHSAFLHSAPSGLVISAPMGNTRLARNAVRRSTIRADSVALSHSRHSSNSGRR